MDTLTTDKIEELLQYRAYEEVNPDEELTAVTFIKDILRSFFAKIDEACDIIKEHYPNLKQSIRISREVTNAVRCNGTILDEMKRTTTQPTMDQFLKKKSS